MYTAKLAEAAEAAAVYCSVAEANSTIVLTIRQRRQQCIVEHTFA